MTNYIKQWWEQSQAKNQADKVSQLRESFYLKEKDGNVWIMHDGVAVFKIPAFASTEETVAYLEESRGYAIECAFGIPYEQKKRGRHIWGSIYPKNNPDMLDDSLSYFNERVDL